MTLLVVKHTHLWPTKMWYNSSDDDDTLVMVTSVLTPGDICGVIDVLDDEDLAFNCTYAALVVCSEGIGCILADAKYFRLL